MCVCVCVFLLCVQESNDDKKLSASRENLLDTSKVQNVPLVLLPFSSSFCSSFCSSSPSRCCCCSSPPSSSPSFSVIVSYVAGEDWRTLWDL